MIVCTPPPINQEPYFKRHKREKVDAAGGLEKVLATYRAAAIKAAETKKAPVVDLNQLFAKEKQDEWLSPDGVHPTVKGKELIAKWVGEAVKLQEELLLNRIDVGAFGNQTVAALLLRRFRYHAGTSEFLRLAPDDKPPPPSSPCGDDVTAPTRANAAAPDG